MQQYTAPSRNRVSGKCSTGGIAVRGSFVQLEFLCALAGLQILGHIGAAAVDVAH